ncbi:MAG: indolepyruvate ferredoxin oxidoreductase subunit alpha, partial [Desulfobacterales bacterium]
MHKLLTEHSGLKMLLLGNEAIARGAVEAGLSVGTTYPGTPSSEISTNFFHISRESDLYFEYSTNEKVALEVAAATANSGLRSMCVMKHVGMNVAADVFMTLAYIGVKGGLVIVTADDPYMFSSQNEQDNRYYSKFSGLPMVEPSSVQEAKDMVAYAFDISEELQQPVIFRTTTRINHSTAEVVFGDIRAPETLGDISKDPFNQVPVPAVARGLHAKLLGKLETAEKMSENSEYNFIEGKGVWGIICNGVSYNYVSDAVKDLSLEQRVKIFRMGFSYPMPRAKIKEFLKACEKVLIVEEGEPFMEETVKMLAQEEKLTLPIVGKSEKYFSRLYEFDPALVRQSMAAYFDVAYTPAKIPDLSDIPAIPDRPPNLCAGCSHRATFYAVKKASEGMDTICPT